jgi:glycosyltransferase involved in cell wall biosynthesis
MLEIIFYVREHKLNIKPKIRKITAIEWMAETSDLKVSIKKVGDILHFSVIENIGGLHRDVLYNGVTVLKNVPDGNKLGFISKNTQVQNTQVQRDRPISQKPPPQLTVPEKRPQKPRVTVGIIALNEEEYINASLKNIYDWDCCYEIIIVEGSTELWREANPDSVTPEGGSKDRTVELIKTFPDHQHKITLVQGKWRDKKQMRNQYLERATGDYLFLKDVDEFYTYNDLEKLKGLLIAEGDTIEQLSIPHIIFWRDFGKKLTGGRYTNLVMERFWKLNIAGERIKHKSHTNMVKADGRGLKVTNSGIKCYHYGNIRTEEFYRNKLDFMELRNERVYKGIHKSVLDNQERWFNNNNTSLGDNVMVIPHDILDHPKAVRTLPRYKDYRGHVGGPLKVLMIFYSVKVGDRKYVGGGQYAMWRWAEALAMHDVDVTLAVSGVPVIANLPLHPNLNVEEIRFFENRILTPEYPQLIFNELKGKFGSEARNFDVVMGSASSYILPSVLFGRYYDVPSINFAYENYVSYSNPVSAIRSGKGIINERGHIDWQHYKQGVLGSDMVIYVSNFVKETAKIWVGEDNFPPARVVYPPINEVVADRVMERIGENGPFTDEKKHIISIGSDPWKKPINHVARAMLKMQHKRPGIFILSGVERELGAYLAIPGLNITTYRGISEEELYEAIYNSCICAVPFLTAGGDYASKHAMYCGVPSITYNVPSLIECTGGHTFVVDETDMMNYRPNTSGRNMALEENAIGKMAELMDWMLDNPDEVIKKTKDGQRYIQDNHTMKVIGKQLKDILLK